MAYTPINWQTGDTITAEKMNKMDNGWGVQNTQLFSETVTTTALSNGNNVGDLAYSDNIDSASIVVTFNGTDYTCPRIDAFGEYFYGGLAQSGPDFSEYPFLIESGTRGNTLYTQTAGTYTVAASGDATVVSANFSSAVNTVLSASSLTPLKCELNETTYAEMLEARNAKRFMYVYLSNDNCVIINSVPDTSSENVSYYPTTTGLTLYFDDNGVLSSIV